MSNSSALFEFSEPDAGTKWVAKPGRQTAFPLSVRNETGEGHDVVVCVEEPANWAWAAPQRISLDPGDLTTVSIVFSPSRETTIAAGEHRAAIRLRDLEGVIFAECTRTFEVEERQELAMTVTLRGPLMSFGLAEGFVLHCNLANRGNVDVSVTPTSDPHPSLSFSQRTVQVPFQGEVSFDIEVRWNASQRSNHPDMVTLRAPYRDGEASASIEWRYIADALEPFMPIYSSHADEDELLSLSWMQQSEQHEFKRDTAGFVGAVEPGAQQRDSSAEKAQAPASNANGATGTVTPNGRPGEKTEAESGAAKASLPEPIWKRPVPLRFPSKTRQVQYTYGRRLNPWWPVVQKSGGRWRIKPLPLLMLVIAVEGMVIGVQESQHDAFQAAAGGKIPPITRALRFIPNTAAAIVGFGKHAILVTFHGAHRLHPIPNSKPGVALAPSGVKLRATAPSKHHAGKQTRAHRPAHPVNAKTPAPVLLQRQPSRPIETHATAIVGPPRISSLIARYVKPDRVEISFVNHGLTNLQLTVADGAKILYNARQLNSDTIHVRVPRRWNHPLQVSLVGSAPHGVVMQRRVWVFKAGLK